MDLVTGKSIICARFLVEVVAAEGGDFKSVVKKPGADIACCAVFSFNTGKAVFEKRRYSLFRDKA